MNINIQESSYLQRLGEHLINIALSLGWDSQGAEGPWEYLSRKTYELAIEDLVNGHYSARSYHAEYVLSKQSNPHELTHQ